VAWLQCCNYGCASSCRSCSLQQDSEEFYGYCVTMGEWKTVIKPKDKLFDLQLKELWKSKYLLWLFVKRDLTVQFKQTIFGFAWYFISPLISVATYVIIFSRVAGIPTDDIPQPLFYMSGVCLWNYFSMCITKISTTFQGNAGLYGKVYFPRLISPISAVFSNMFKFSIQLVLFVALYLYFTAVKGVNNHPNIYLTLFPIIVILLAGIAFGLGLIVTSLTTKYRDLSNFFGVFVSLWMYATPIVYPMSAIENASLKHIMSLNPLTPIIEAFKYGSMGAGEFSWSGLTYSTVTMIILIIIGVLMFNRKQKVFIDTI